MFLFHSYFFLLVFPGEEETQAKGLILHSELSGLNGISLEVFLDFGQYNFSNDNSLIITFLFLF
jgi:hypothetical protein